MVRVNVYGDVKATCTQRVLILLEELNLNPAVGIAAPQVGITKNMCVVYIEFEEGEKVDLILINKLLIILVIIFH